jgi:hypothetical protein
VIEGVAGATIKGAGQSTFTLNDGADGSSISGIKIFATDGGNALYSFPGHVVNVALNGNIFDAGSNTSGALVYVGDGSDGWSLSNNTFNGELLTNSPLLGLEGQGHSVTGNTFGPVSGSYVKVESFTPSVVFSNNVGLDVKFMTGGHTYSHSVVNVSDISGAGVVEAAHGSAALASSGSPGRGAVMEFISTDAELGRLRFNETFDKPNEPAPIRLDKIDILQFDFLLKEANRTDIAPSLRLRVDADGDMATTSDRGDLVIEWASQGLGLTPKSGFGAVPQEKWTTFDIGGRDLIAWQAANGKNFFDGQTDYRPLSVWATGGRLP